MALLRRRVDRRMMTGLARVERKTSPTRNGAPVVASAMPIEIGDRVEAERLMHTRQAWQAEAWVYRRSLGELRYATAYMGNSHMRLRLFIGAYEGDQPVPVELNETDTRLGIPADLISTAKECLNDLGRAGGPIGLAGAMKRLAENFQIAGEVYLVGQYSNETREVAWSLHSISEVHIDRDGRVGIREIPGNSNKGVQYLDPQQDYISRLWTPDPQWGMLADSPVRGILDICEELLLIGRDVRATIRSRLANNGVLLVPDGLSIVSAEPETDDDEGDPFFAELIRAAESAITNEGDASAAVPLVVRGPSEALNGIKHLVMDRPQNQFNITQRAELISRMATGIDLPAEVLTGKVDLNHWTSWQVDDDSFRHHIEPAAIQEVDAITVGYLWKMLDAMGRWPRELVRRLVIWYDPTELVTHPDRTQDGLQLWDRLAVSDDTLRKIAGFTDADAPSDDEKLLRIAMRMRSIDPSIQGQILKILDPNLTPPPAKTTPPAGGGGGAPADDTPAPSQPGPPPAATSLRDRIEMAEALLASLSVPVTEPEPAPEPAPTAKAVSHDQLARRLVDLDRRLRERVHTAANAAVRRALERAGARIVTKSRGPQHAAVREAIKDVPLPLVAATLGPRIVAALGFREQELLDTAYEELRTQWDRWVADGQRQSLREVAKAAGVDMNAAFARLDGTFRENRAEGWAWLQEAMQRAASRLFVSLDSLDDGETDLTFTDLVTMGDIRASLALAGGFGDDSQSSGLTEWGVPADPMEPMGQVGTGDTLSGFMSANGMTREGYQWVWGGSLRPFEPHMKLDGTRYSNFDDPQMGTNGGDFPAGGYYYPGDHNGCSCDFMPIIISNPQDAATDGG